MGAWCSPPCCCCVPDTEKKSALIFVRVRPQDAPVAAPTYSLEDLEGSDGEVGEDGSGGSEVEASSEGELDPNEYKQDVENTLKDTGANLKRGKTQELKEAINTAKKLGVEEEIIQEAEKQLAEHKKKQKREATEEEVCKFFESKHANEIPHVKKMLKAAQAAECSDELIDRLEDHLDDLILIRPLESDEHEYAREYMMCSCKEFVFATTVAGGRPVVFLNLTDGKKTAAMMSLDPPLQNLIIVIDHVAEILQTQITTLRATAAMKESTVFKSKGYAILDEEDAVSSVALKHEFDGKVGVWCLIEPTLVRRDRLIEAIDILTKACKAAVET